MGNYMIAITGGGTGGHIFPNISIVEELKIRGEKNIVWIGEKGGKEELFAKKLNIPFYGIKAGKIRRYFSLKNFSDLFLVVLGFFQSLFLLSKLKPKLLFSKGGFVSIPPAFAARVLRVPVLTHESDINPGLANRLISKASYAVCTSFKETSPYFPGKRVFYTGNPVRKVIKDGNSKRGKIFLGFKEDLPFVMVVGGSLGAQSINNTIYKIVDNYDLPFNLVHQCGRGNLNNTFIKIKKYRQYEFLGKEIGDVMAVSTLIISRAGAGALYEISYLGKPSILIPLSKTASRGEQVDNAKFFEENGASIVILNDDLNEKILFKTVCNLLENKNTLVEMGKKAFRLLNHNAEEKIVDIIEDILKE